MKVSHKYHPLSQLFINNVLLPSSSGDVVDVECTTDVGVVVTNGAISVSVSV